RADGAWVRSPPRKRGSSLRAWVPACAGMSGVEVLASSDGSRVGNGECRCPPYGPSLQNQVELQDLVKGDGGVVDPVAGRLAVAAHRIETIADRADREPVARMRRGRQHLPAVGAGGIGFPRPEGRGETFG